MTQNGGSILSLPHEEHFRFMSAKNQIVEIDHVFPATVFR
jgi:hypothetical protein